MYDKTDLGKISKIYFYSIQFNKQKQMFKSKQNQAPPMAYNYMEEVPIKYEERSCTDICCTIVGIVFSLVLIILALCLFNYDTYLKTNFPTDSDGNLCGVDAPGYPYVYFANAPEISRRVCVSSCPDKDTTQLDCLMTENVGCRFSDYPGFEVTKYETYHSQATSVGSYCLPEDENMRYELLKNANLETRIAFINSLNTIVLSMIISLCLSILYVVLVQFCPKIMNKAVIILGCLFILALSICMFAYHWVDAGKWVVASLLLVLFFIIVIHSCKNRRALDMNGVFLEAGTKMLRTSKCTTFLYIPLFMLLLAGFILLIIYEFRSFWAGGSITFDPSKSIFYEFQGALPIVLMVFLVIQAIWGFSFLKESFNYLVSGNAVSWYYYPADAQWSCGHPIKTFLCKHFGSVVGGSFMTGFFTIGDYLLDIIKPPVTTRKSGCYYRSFKTCCNPCVKLFDLVRSDAMAYINIAGNPYCNAARYCEYLSDNSVILEQSQSTSMSYRICAHMLIAGIVGIISLYIKGSILPTCMLIIIVLSLFISTYFISIHADAAEAIAISFMDNEECEKRKLGNRTSNIRESTFDNMAVKHHEVAEEVKKVLIEHPYKEESLD